MAFFVDYIMVPHFSLVIFFAISLVIFFAIIFFKSGGGKIYLGRQTELDIGKVQPDKAINLIPLNSK